jgi:hypothetical protein
MRRWRWKTDLMVLGLVAVLLTLAGLWHWKQREHPSKDQLVAQGEQMIAVIEAFKAEHGRYPDSFAEAGITPPTHSYGPWRYEQYRGHFTLAVGDYGKDQFSLSYTSGSGWYLDT